MTTPKRDGGLSDRFRFLVAAQVEVNRAVHLYNTKTFGYQRTVLDPADYSDAAIDAKISAAIDALESSLVSPRRAKPREAGPAAGT